MIDYSIRFTSDWAIGNGTGAAGGVDRTVALDGDGLPYVPASTVRQVVRDAAEQVAAALDRAHDDSPWGAFVAVLFGDRRGGPEGHGLLTVTPARLPAQLRADLRADDERSAARRRALVGVVPAVRIDDVTGTATDRHLRFEERATTGAVVTGTISLLPGYAADLVAVRALLSAASSLVVGLGHARRRGAGWAELRVLDAPGGDHLRRVLAEVPELPAPAPAEGGPADDPATYEPAQRRAVVEFDVDLDAPVVARSGLRGNVTTSHDHVPGNTMLPLVARSLAAVGIDVAGLLAVDAITVGPAVPVAEDGTTMLPIPLTWAWAKGAADAAEFDVVDLAAGSVEGRLVPARPGRWVDASGGVIARTDMSARTRNHVDVATQAVGEAGVFTRQSISAGQRLRFAVHLPEDLAARTDWQDGLVGEHRIGTARRTDDGRVTVSRADTHGLPSSQGPHHDAYVLLVTASAVTPPTAEGVAAAANDVLEAAGHASRAAVGDGRHAVRTQRLDSWHGRWDLPRSTIVTCAAGSVVHLRFDPPLDDEGVAVLEDAGIGDRRGEGLGRLLVAPGLVGTTVERRVTRASVGVPARDATAPESSAAERQFLATLDVTAAQAVAADLVMTITRDAQWRGSTVRWTESGPSNSQLGHLRGAAASAEPGAAVAAMLARIEQLERVSEDGQTGWTAAQVSAVRAVMADPLGSLGDSVPAWVREVFQAADGLSRELLGGVVLAGAAQAEVRQRAGKEQA